jgi:hypothetical protein
MAALPSRVLQVYVVSMTRTCLPFQENQAGLITPREKTAPTFMGSLISTGMTISIVNICSLVKGQKFREVLREREGKICCRPGRSQQIGGRLLEGKGEKQRLRPVTYRRKRKGPGENYSIINYKRTGFVAIVHHEGFPAQTSPLCSTALRCSPNFMSTFMM